MAALISVASSRVAKVSCGVTVRRSPPCLGVAIRSNRAREADATEPGVVDGDGDKVATKRPDGEKLRAARKDRRFDASVVVSEAVS
jgi:hypothetical protein